MLNTNEIEISASIVESVACELDHKYGLVKSSTDIHAGGEMRMAFKDSVDHAFAILKASLDDAIRKVRMAGEALCEEVFAKFCQTYETMKASVGARVEELLNRLTDLLRAWREHFYTHIMKSIPRQICLEDGAYEIESVTLVQSLEIGGSLTSSVSSLLAITARGHVDVQTAYQWAGRRRKE
jgi:hypothetical protein